MWQRIRRKWSDPRVEPGYSEGGIWKTTDGGKTWTEANAGPAAPQFRGRIGIDIAQSNPNVLYAFVDNYEPGAAAAARTSATPTAGRSCESAHQVGRDLPHRRQGRDAGGRSSESNDFMTRPLRHVRLGVRPDPRRSDRREHDLHAGPRASTFRATPARRSRRLRGMHGDHHGLWIDPKNPSTLYNANDGGFYSSEDAGKTWKFAVTRRRRAVLQRDARQQLAGLGLRLDPGSRQPPRQSRSQRRSRQDPGRRVGERPRRRGFASGGRPRESEHRLFARLLRELHAHGPERSAAGRGRRRRRRREQRRRTRPCRGVTNIRPPGGRVDLRAQWMAPIIVSPHDPNTVYAGYQFVFRSTNRGDAWEKISADLTANDPSQMLLKSSNAIPYQTITALAESPRVKGLLYAGTDDGRLHVTTRRREDLDRSRPRVPTRKWYSRVVPSQHDEANRLRHAARPRRRRLRRLRLQVDRLRQDVHQHRRQPPGRPGERDSRGSDERQHAVRWAPTSAPSSPPTAASRGRCSAATCRPCRSRISPYHAARQHHRHLDVRPRDVGHGCGGGEEEVTELRADVPTCGVRCAHVRTCGVRRAHARTRKVRRAARRTSTSHVRTSHVSTPHVAPRHVRTSGPSTFLFVTVSPPRASE